MASNTYGAIKLSTAEDVGAVLKKKTGSEDGYKPKEWADTINLLGLLPIRTASGTIAHFEDGADDVPMKSIVANIVPIQSGSGTPSPSNPRPISGTSELTLKHKGKNLFDPNTEFSTLYVYAVAKNVLPSATCTMSFTDNDTTQDISGVYFGFVSSNYTGGAPTVYRWGIQNGSVVGDVTNLYLSENMTGLFYYPNNPTTLEKILNRFNVQIELGNTTPTTYEPYNAETYTFDLGQEILGGSADVVGGTGSKTHGSVDLGDSSNNWSYVNGVFYSAPIYPVTYLATYNRIVCSIYKDVYVVTSAEMNDNEIRCYSNRLYIKDSRFTDVASFVEGVTGEKVCYELATPTDFTFTGQPINSLLGTNNVWTDSGEVLDVEYRADMNLLIAELGG